ncbi:MAG: hypothetical protein AAF927_17145 [Bacteroidota bacterium]
MKSYHIYYRLLACLLLACLGQNLSAQNVKQDIERINEAYRSLKGGQVELEYRFYAGYDPDNVEITKGRASWQGVMQKMHTPSIERLQNDQYAILVNHDMKAVIIQNAPSTSTLASPIPLDSMLAICDSIQFQEKEEGLLSYRFLIGALGFEAVEVVFNPESYFIERIVCYQLPWEEGELGDRTEVHYRNLQKLSTTSTAHFSEQDYVRRDGEQFLLQSAYKGYKLYNFCR